MGFNFLAVDPKVCKRPCGSGPSHERNSLYNSSLPSFQPSGRMSAIDFTTNLGVFFYKGSNYMQAANSRRDTQSATYALIPTTIIYSRTDEVVTPQVGINASSRLIGASNIAIQDICGIIHNPGHFFIVGDLGVYGVALDALLNGRPAQPSTIDRSYCTKTAQSLGFQTDNLANDLQFAFRTAIGDHRGQMIASQFNTLRTRAEPLLQQYVCDRGYTISRCTGNGFRIN